MNDRKTETGTKPQLDLSFLKTKRFVKLLNFVVPTDLSLRERLIISQLHNQPDSIAQLAKLLGLCHRTVAHCINGHDTAARTIPASFVDGVDVPAKQMPAKHLPGLVERGLVAADSNTTLKAMVPADWWTKDCGYIKIYLGRPPLKLEVAALLSLLWSYARQTCSTQLDRVAYYRLANQLGVDKEAVGGWLDELELRGFVVVRVREKNRWNITLATPAKPGDFFLDIEREPKQRAKAVPFALENYFDFSHIPEGQTRIGIQRAYNSSSANGIEALCKKAKLNNSQTLNIAKLLWAMPPERLWSWLVSSGTLEDIIGNARLANMACQRKGIRYASMYPKLLADLKAHIATPWIQY